MMRFNQLQYITGVGESSEATLNPELERVLIRVRLRAKRRVAWLRKLWHEEGESGGKLAVTHAEIDTCLDDRDSPEAEDTWFASDESVRQWNREIAEAEAEMAADSTSRLAQFQDLFGLSEAEFDLFQTCLAVALDPSLARVYAYLHDHAGRGYATEVLAARLFGHGRSSLWHADSSICRWELVKEKEVGPGEPAQLTCDPLIRDWFLGHTHLDESLVGIAKVCPPATPLANWPIDANVAFLKRMIHGGTPSPVRLRIEGVPGSGRRTLAATLSEKIGLSTLAIDTDQIDEKHWQQVFVRAQRQAYLNQYALAWYGEHALRRAWPQVVPFFPVQFIIGEAGQRPLAIPGMLDERIEMPVPSLEERRELWKRFVPVSATWPKLALEKLVEQHRATIGDIISLAR